MMDDSVSDVFLKARSACNYSLNRWLMIATVVCCIVIAIIGIALISKTSSNDTTYSGNSSNSGSVDGCPSGSVKIMNKCLMFLKESGNLSWSESRAKCQEKGADLAIIDDCNLMHKLIGYIHANSLEADQGYWIGATDQGNEGVWKWIDGASVDLGAPFWGTEVRGNFNLEPAGAISQNCLQLYGPDAYTFHDGGCVDSKSALCEAPLDSDGTCPANFMLIRGQCFQFVQTLGSWESSGRRCASETTGGRLAHLKDCRVFGDIVNKIRTEDLTRKLVSIWIGGNDRGFENVWTWTDGSQVELGAPFWGKDETGKTEPNGGTSQNCAAMLKKDRYYFHDTDCSSSTGFIPLCEFTTML